MPNITEVMINDSAYRCGFVVYENWQYKGEHYFLSRSEAEKFIKELQTSLEEVWPIDGY